jgi:RNA polymerase sigma-70 factor (ECF subfamily)
MTRGRPDGRLQPTAAGERATQLEAAYRGVHADLVRYLGLVVGSAAEDVASQTWVDALAGFERFTGNGADLRRWLFAIARRRAVDHRRRWWQRKVTPLPPGELESGSGTAPEADDRQATRWALAQIAGLPADQAEIVLLRVMAGFTAEDVAVITGRTATAVRVIQHRALRRLARELERTHGDGV